MSDAGNDLAEWRSLESLSESFTDAQLQVDALRRLIDLSDLGLARCSVDGRILYVTPRFATYLRQPTDDLLARSLHDMIPADAWGHFEEYLKAEGNREPTPIFVPTLTPEGEVPLVWTVRRVTLADTTQELHLTVRPAREDDPHPGPAGRQMQPVSEVPEKDEPRPLTGNYIQDITLWELEQTTLMRGEVSQSGAWIMDMPNNIVVWSESAFLTLGVPAPPPGEPNTMGFESWIHPDDLQRTAELLYERFISPGRFVADVRGIRGDGMVRNIHAIGETYKTREDLPTPDRAFGFFIDQTDEIIARRTLNMALRIDAIFAASREEHTTLLSDLVDIITRHGGFSYAAYHQRNSNGASFVAAHSGTNRFMATEETRRVEEAFGSGNPAHITEQTHGHDITLATFFPVIVNRDVDGVLVVWSEEPGQFTERIIRYLADLSVNLGHLIESRNAADQTQRVLRTLTTMFGAAIESHTPFEAGRHPRIAALSKAIAEDLGLEAADVFGIEMSASIYDMGMLWISDRITLAHPGSLTEEDKIAVRRHADIGQSIAAAFKWPWPIAEVMGQHHEHWDGTGYPNGLAGEDIALAARIVAVTSTYESLTRNRPYQTTLSADDVLRSIQVKAGTVFDPTIVESLSKVIAGGFRFAEQPASPTLKEAESINPSRLQDR